MNAIERFLKYVAIDTQSDEESTTYPSTQKQVGFLSMLATELEGLGVSVDFDGKYVIGSLERVDSNTTLAFIAHVDTSPAVSGENVKTVLTKYNGGDIVLENAVIEEKSLEGLLGQTIISSDGNTLLGADDKAGVAEIMSAAEKIMNSDIKHGKICIGFTPDEEIGRGADLFDVDGFGAEYAYTLDGGGLGEIEYENFNAASAVVKVNGRAIHPGSAKDKMINAVRISAEFDSMLTPDQIPEKTEGYEGFHHLLSIEGETELSVSKYIIRDHSKEKFVAIKAEFEAVAKALNKKYGEGTVELILRDSYYNMKEILEDKMYVVERATSAMERLGMTAHAVPIRGGTDGARLSFMCLPCPNLPTGGGNYHSRFEYVSVDAMESCVDLVIEIVKG